MRRAVGILAMGALLIAATPTAFGGWVVVTLQELPEYLEAGKATTLSFTMRQHGRDLMQGRSPTLTLSDTDAGFVAKIMGRDKVTAVGGAEPGLYHAEITAADTGRVSVTIDTDLARWKVKLMPIRVVAAGASAPPAVPAHERGRDLFVAKGCVTCHMKKDDPALADWRVIQAGPELTARTFPADWLAQKLADPTRLRGGGTAASDVMPQLTLSETEIGALVSYLNQRQMTLGQAN